MYYFTNFYLDPGEVKPVQVDPRIDGLVLPLIENVVGLILQYGRVTVSEACFKSGSSPKNVNRSLDDDINKEEVGAILANDDTAMATAARVQAVFKRIMDNSVLEKRTY